MGTAYSHSMGNARIVKGGAALGNVAYGRITPPSMTLAGGRLLDRFREKMRTANCALATEKSYRYGPQCRPGEKGCANAPDRRD